MLRKSIFALVSCVIWASAALAAVPTQDVPRERMEKSIADCMQRSRVLKQQQLPQNQGTRQSVQTPSPSNVPTVGGTDVSASGVTAPSNNTVSGMDFSQVPMQAPGGGQSASALSMNSTAQTVQSMSNLGTTLPANVSSLQNAVPLIGALQLSQAAWSQNSGSRINTGALWNQLIMIEVLTAQLFNNRNLLAVSGASWASQVLTFNPSQASFVGPSVTPNSNAVVVQLPVTH